MTTTAGEVCIALISVTIAMLISLLTDRLLLTSSARRLRELRAIPFRASSRPTFSYSRRGADAFFSRTAFATDVVSQRTDSPSRVTLKKDDRMSIIFKWIVPTFRFELFVNLLDANKTFRTDRRRRTVIIYHFSYLIA